MEDLEEKLNDLLNYGLFEDFEEKLDMILFIWLLTIK